MNKWLELLLGLIFLIGAILVGWYSWGGSGAGAWMIGRFSFDFLHAAWIVLKGGVWWFVVMLGVLLILLGLSDLRG